MKKKIKILSKKDFKFSSWEEFLSSYTEECDEGEADLVYMSGKLWEELSGKSIKLPDSELNSYDLEKLETRCAYCGCPFFSYNSKTELFCTLDEFGDTINDKVNKNNRGLLICRGCHDVKL